MADICEDFECRLCLEDEYGMSSSVLGAAKQMMNAANVVIKDGRKSGARS